MGKKSQIVPIFSNKSIDAGAVDPQVSSSPSEIKNLGFDSDGRLQKRSGYTTLGSHSISSPFVVVDPRSNNPILIGNSISAYDSSNLTIDAVDPHYYRVSSSFKEIGGYSAGYVQYPEMREVNNLKIVSFFFRPEEEGEYHLIVEVYNKSSGFLIDRIDIGGYSYSSAQKINSKIVLHSISGNVAYVIYPDASSGYIAWRGISSAGLISKTQTLNNGVTAPRLTNTLIDATEIADDSTFVVAYIDQAGSVVFINSNETSAENDFGYSVQNHVSVAAHDTSSFVVVVSTDGYIYSAKVQVFTASNLLSSSDLLTYWTYVPGEDDFYIQRHTVISRDATNIEIFDQRAWPAYITHGERFPFDYPIYRTRIQRSDTALSVVYGPNCIAERMILQSKPLNTSDIFGKYCVVGMTGDVREARGIAGYGEVPTTSLLIIDEDGRLVGSLSHPGIHPNVFSTPFVDPDDSNKIKLVSMSNIIDDKTAALTEHTFDFGIIAGSDNWVIQSNPNYGIHLLGSAPGQLTQNKIAENGFFSQPYIEIETTTTGSSTPLSNGKQYAYVAVYENVDNYGNITYSQLGNVYKITPSPTSAAVVHIQANIGYPTNRGTNNCSVALFRTTADGASYYRIAGFPTASGIDSNGGVRKTFISHYDYTTDSGSIYTAPVLYTTGNILEQEPPYPHTIMCFHQNRYFYVKEGSSSDIYYSDLYQSFETPKFSNHLTLVVPAEGGAITSIHSFLGLLWVFKRNKIFVVGGEGADSRGINPTYNVRITSSSEGAKHHGVVTSYQGGVIFLSDSGVFSIKSPVEAPIFVGAAVKYYTDNYSYTRVHVDASKNEIIFYGDTDSAGSLVFNYKFNRWTVNSITVQDIAQDTAGQNHYSSDGSFLHKHNSSIITDGEDYINTSLTSPWVAQNQVGYQRVRQVHLSGYNRSDTTVYVDSGYDYSPDWEVAYSTTTSGLTNFGSSLHLYGMGEPPTTTNKDQAAQFRLDTPRQLCTSYRVRVRDEADIGFPSTSAEKCVHKYTMGRDASSSLTTAVDKKGSADLTAQGGNISFVAGYWGNTWARQFAAAHQNYFKATSFNAIVQAFTIAVWVYDGGNTGGGTDNTVIAIPYDSTQYTAKVYWKNAQNELAFRIDTDEGSFESWTTITVSGWTQIVCTYDPTLSANRGRIYKNGVEAEQVDATGTLLTNITTGDAYVGGENSSSVWVGYIDDLAWYNEAKSSTWVAWQYERASQNFKGFEPTTISVALANYSTDIKHPSSGRNIE